MIDMRSELEAGSKATTPRNTKGSNDRRKEDANILLGGWEYGGLLA